jgi:diguanylate cyclase (GGDEF)-like protein
MPFSADNAMWIAIAIGVSALGLSAALAVYVVRARRSPSADMDVVKATVSRTEAMVAELRGALEDARAESRRSRMLADLSSTIDLEVVLERTLELALGLPRVDAAMISLQGDEEPVVVTAGMTAEEAARQPVSRPAGSTARAVRIDYRYDDGDEGSRARPLIRGGIAVPLRDAADDPRGTLAVFWRGSERAVSDEELAQLEELAASSGPALHNAQRFREARRLADLDALTGLHNRRYFHETLEREVSRADRYDRRLALIIVDIDDFKAINDRIGHLGGDSVLAGAAERLRSVVRSADVACRVGGDELAVILPEAGLSEAEELYRRIRSAFESRPVAPAENVNVSAGIAELRPEDDAVSFFQRADEALYQAKEGGKGRAHTAGGSGEPEE